MSRLKAFISYSHVDRHVAASAKSLFNSVGIDAFLAHEDLEVSEEWRERILEELKRCDIFVPLLSVNFLASKWAPQEVGFIISRPEVVIAPLSIDGTVPFGFFSHRQSRPIPREGITPQLLVEPLARHLPPVLIDIAVKARDFRSAEERMKSLVPLFGLFTREEAERLAHGAVGNAQIWDASKCSGEYLPEFMRVCGIASSPQRCALSPFRSRTDVGIQATMIRSTN